MEEVGGGRKSKCIQIEAPSFPLKGMCVCLSVPVCVCIGMRLHVSVCVHTCVRVSACNVFFLVILF